MSLVRRLLAAAFGGGLLWGRVDVKRDSEGQPDVTLANSEVASGTSRGLGNGPTRGRRIHLWSAARLLHCGLWLAWGRRRRTWSIKIRDAARLVAAWVELRDVLPLVDHKS